MIVKRQQKPSFNTMELYSPCQSSIKDPDHLYRLSEGWGKAAGRSRPPKTILFLAVKLDSVLMYLCVGGKKMSFLSWAIRPVFVDLVKNE